MGWWRPYFFFDTDGVQLLVPWFALGGASSHLLGALVVLALSGADRLLARTLTAARASHDDRAAALLYALSRLTSGLIMLLMMSFNIWIFLWTVLSLGFAEFLVLRRASRAGGSSFALAGGPVTSHA